MKYLIFVLSFISVTAFASDGELKGGSQYEHTIRIAGCPIIGFAWGRA